ncbi:MAG: nucleotide exchange factor GrpE [Patescibacteria group bacterium]
MTDEEKQDENQIDADQPAAVGLVAEYKDKWLRAVADYQNLKKDTAKDKENWIKFANAGLIMELLPILNHFKEAIKHVPETEKETDWVVGIFHIKKQLEDFLGQLGITEIKTIGEKFNPEFHEAISQKEVEGKEPDEIVEEVLPGYLMHDKVIEPAKVIVSK